MFTPESTVDVQLAYGSDIAMVLDECLGYPATHEETRVSTARTDAGRGADMRISWNG
jgi:Queuine/archaeosine tRNA-ribosyltransferase